MRVRDDRVYLPRSIRECHGVTEEAVPSTDSALDRPSETPTTDLA